MFDLKRFCGLRSRRSRYTSIIFILGIISIIPLSAQSSEGSKIADAAEILSEITTIPESAIPPILLRNAFGIAIIPDVIRAGFVIGGRYGQGILLVKRENESWSPPIFITLTGASLGYQIGIQSTDVILVFKSKKGVDSVFTGKFIIGADASAAIGPLGREVSASTNLTFEAEIYSYSRSKGFFAGIALDGAALQIDHNANAAFYRQEAITPDDIINKKKTDELIRMEPIYHLLNGY